MKAILVFDKMPIGCLDCKLHIGLADFAGMSAGCYCLSTGLTNHDGTKRGARCPLKDMPKKKAISGTQIIKEAHEQNIDPARYAGYCAGWNECIDSLGDEAERNGG